MEMPGRSYGRSYNIATRRDFRQPRYVNPSAQPLMGRSWKMERSPRQQYFSIEPDYTEELLSDSPHSSTRAARPHPYMRPHMPQRFEPNLYYNDEPSSPPNEVESGPRPLIPPETLAQLRSSLRFARSRLNSNTEEYEYEQEPDDGSYYGPGINEPTDPIEYVREEEENTKQQIEDIIMVAQALREKLEREEMRRISAPVSHVSAAEDYDDYELSYPEPQTPPYQDYPSTVPPTNIEFVSDAKPGEIPRLMDLKPKIPSLMDIYVSPPPIENVLRENTIVANREFEQEDPDICWNCDKIGHRYVDCRFPKMKKFCFRCGSVGYDLRSCPYCK